MTGSAILSPADVAIAYFDRLDRGAPANVFEIRRGLIERVAVYLDPDYVSEDTERFLWKDRKSQW